ncbi:putative regulatory protein [Vibrio phage 1.034.O._10N.261.46.B7]|nr:putative regulatory protein [Vibrio phage 1.034.O._10N.261.46.B7]AUR83433.1 putative regulatory protein [Vibrio phage 1.034.X._10N.261.46.B7]
MAVYLYGCPSGHEQEEKHGMTEAPEIKCKECDKLMSKKLTAGYTGSSSKFFAGNNHESYGDGRY